MLEQTENFIYHCVLTVCNNVSEVCLLSKSKRVQVAFTESQWKLLEKLRGVFGDGDADIVRNIVLAWLSEKSLISTAVKNKGN